MPRAQDNRDHRITRPVVVLLVAHLLSAAVWFRETGCLGLPQFGLPTLYFEWPAFVALVFLLHRRLSRLQPGTGSGRWKRLLLRILRLLPRILFGITLVALVVGLVAFFRSGTVAEVATESARLSLVLASVAAFILFFLTRWAAATAEDTDSSELRSMIGLSWIGVGLHALSAAALALITYAAFDCLRVVQAIFACILVVLVAEVLLLAVLEFYRPAAQRGSCAPGTSALLGWLMARSNPLTRIAEAIEQAYGIKLGELWALQFLKKLILPLVLLGLLVLWLATSLTMIPAESEGVRTRTGRFLEKPLGPGLHVGLPWPFDEVIILRSKRVDEIHLGFDTDLGGPVLWNERHYEGERNMLADSGETLLTVSVIVQYRIGDPLAYVSHAGGHKDALRLIAYRELVHTLAARESFDTMITKREEISRQMAAAIQTNADEIGLGLEVMFVALRDIHPPVDVASAYQDVVSAEEERHALVNGGLVYKQIGLPRAKLMANRRKKGAEGYAMARKAFATGDAVAFEAVADAFAESPALLRRERWLQALEESLTGRPKLITGRTDEMEAEPMYIDFRFSGEGMPAPADNMMMEDE